MYKSNLYIFYKLFLAISRREFIFFLATIFLLFLTPAEIRADGSKSLYPNGVTGYRAYLGSHSSGTAYNPFPTTGKTFAYAKVGDTLYLGTSVQGMGYATIRVEAPNGVVYSSGSSTTVGRISNRTQEKNGPDYPGYTLGYTPYTIIVGAGQEGIWAINFISQDTTATSNPTNIAANSEWSSAPGSANMIAAWDVSVRNAGTFITGRVFTTMFHGVMNTPFDNGFYGKFYVLTKDGYLYLVDNNGQQGLNFAWFSNNKGLKTAAGEASYLSYNSTTDPPIKDPRTPDGLNDITQKVFYEIPASDMPATTATSSGYTWLKQSSALSPTVSNFSFVGKEGTPNLAGTYPLGGYINFTASDNCNYAIDIDANNNGVYTDAVDRRLSGSAYYGSNSVLWNGLNGQGNKISAGTSAIKIRIFLLGGEIHFPFFDLEDNRSGLIIKLLNSSGTPVTNADTIFWDDTGITSSGGPSNPVKTGIVGVRSSVNGHKFGDGTDVGFGNEKVLDTWTYTPGNIIVSSINIELRESNLEVVSITPSTSSLCPGGSANLTYTVLTRNNGPGNITGAKFKFTFPTEMTNISCSTSTTGTATVTSKDTLVAGEVSAVANMNNGATITYYIAGIVGNSPGGGVMNVTGSMMRIADLTDPDATNTDIATPTNPQSECDADTVGCNNIKTNSGVTVGSANTITAPSSICAASGNPSAFNASTVSGSPVYRWEYSTNGVSNWLAVPNGSSGTTYASEDYNPTTISVTTYYRRKVKISGCTDTIISNIGVIYVGASPTNNTITYNGLATACGAYDPPTIIGSTPTGGTGTYFYQWQSSTVSDFSSSVTTISGATGIDYDPPSISPTTTIYFRRNVTSTSCSTAGNSNIVSITVNASVSNAIVDPTIYEYCVSGNPAVIANESAPGGSPTYLWQSSTDGSSYSTASGTSNTQTYDPPSLSVGTYYYRRQITSGGCTNYSNVVVITVNTDISNTIIAPGTTDFCSTGDASSITGTPTGGGASGNYTIQWQVSTDSTNYNDIVGANSIPYDPPSVSGTRYYRRLITTPTCATVTSNVIKITIHPTSVGGSISGGASVCTGTNSTNLTLSGHTGSIVRWQSSTASDFSTGLTNIANTTTTQTASNLTATTYYRAIIKSGVCDSASSASATVTVNPASVGGTIAGSATVCTGTNSTNLTLSGHTGSIVRWQSSTVSNFSSNVTNIANTTTTHTASNLTATTYYRAIIKSGVCDSISSASATVTVSPASVGGSFSGGHVTVCTGTNSTTLTLSGHTGSIQWQKSTTSATTGFTNITDSISATLRATNLTTKTYYRAVVTSGSCSAANSTTDSIMVSPTSVGGTIAGGASVCTGTNSTNLTLSGHTGSIVRWQSSTASDFSTGLTNIANTTTTQTASNLTATTYYRAIVKSGVCDSASSASATVTVNPASVGGTIAGSATVCTGTNSTNLTLSGHTGSIVRWQSSTVSNFSSNVTNIANTTTTHTASNLTATTYYRAIIKSGVCDSASSASATVTVSPASVGGSFSGGNVSVCTGTNSTTLTLSGHTGSIQWQKSTTSATTGFTNITDSISATLRATNLTTKTYYRAVVTSGSCSAANSTTDSIMVSPTSVGGTIAGGASVCTGTNSTNLTLSGHTGSIVRWQSSTASDFSTGLTNIANTTTTQTASNLTATTYYRAIVKSGVCDSASSASATVTVNPASVGGTIAGSATVCTGTNSTNLTLSGHTGSIVRWQSSTVSNFSSNVTNIANTTTTHTASNLTATTYYRAIIKSGVCDSASSASATVTVSPASVGGSFSGGNVSVCTGTNSTTLTLSGYTGSIQWQKSTTSATTGFSNITDSISATLRATNLTTKTYYRAVVTSGSCSAANSSTDSIMVSPTSVGGTIAGGASVCTGTNSTNLTLSGHTGSIVRWQSSTASDFSTGLTNIANTTTTQTASNLTATTYYRAIVKSGVCDSASSASATVTVNPASVGGTIAGSATVCTGTNSTNLTLSGHTGSIVRWQSSTVSNFSSNVTNIANTTTTHTASNLTATTYYRAIIKSGVCDSASSASATVTVSPASVGGSFSGGNVSVCTGTNSTTLTLSGYTGSIQWQKSTTSATTGFSNITDSISATLRATNLTTKTYYRAVVTSGSCSAANSTTDSIMVSPTSVGGTIAGGASVCTGTNSTNLTLSGHTGSIVRWQSSTASDFSTGLTNIANTTTTQTASNLTATTYYRAIIKSGVCDSISSASATVTVNPASVGGSISGGATVCTGTNSTNLTLSGHTGSIVRWQSSTASDFSTGLTNIANTTTTHTASNLTATTYYRAIIKSGVCDSASSASATVTVSPASVGGSFSGGNVSVCTGTNSTTLTLSGYTGSIQWQKSTTSATTGFSNITDSISATLRATNLTTKTYYRAVVTSGSCSAANSTTDSIMVSPTSVGGSIAGGASVCTGTNSTNLTLSGHTGSIVRWQSSTASDFSTGLTNIVNTTTTQTASNLTATTYYRAIIKSGVCDSISSASATVTVNPASVGGSISGGATVCTGTNSTNLTLSGHTGSIVRWQSSTVSNFSSNVTNIANTTTTHTASNLTATTYYRAIIKSGVCDSASSASATVTVSPASVGGSFSGGNVTVCTGTNSTTLTLSGHTGSIQWQKSTTSATTGFSNITDSISATLRATNLTTKTYYRAVVTSGSCSAANSTTDSIMVSPTSVGGTIAGGASVCTGTNSTNLTLSGHTGSIVRWQSSTASDFSTGLTNIVNTTTTQTASNLTATTYYRAIIKSGVCDSASSASATVTVNPASVGGSISGGATVCTGTNSTNLTLSGHTGSIVRWQSSTVSNFSSNVTNIANTTTTHTASNLTATTYYRAIIKSGVCDSASSASATVTVSPASVGGSFSGGNVSVCTGTNSTTLTLSGYTGSIQWQKSTTSATTGFSNITDSISATLRATNLTTKTYYRAVVTSGSCSAANSTTDSIMVSPTSVGGSIAGGASVCTGTNSTNLTLSGHTGSIVRWQSSTASDFSTGLTNIVNTTTTQTASNLTATTYYRAIIKSGVCDSASSASATVTVNIIPSISTTTPASRCGTGTVVLGATASTGTINWYASSTGGSSLGTGTSFTTPSISSTTKYYIDATASGCTTASRDSVTATVNDIPSISTTTPASRCGTGTVVLGATASTGTINWYASSTGGSSLGTGTSFTTPSISSTTKYYIDATASGCTTASRDSVTATVNNLPSTPTAGVDGSRTGPGSVNISASVSGGETIDWYAASTGGSVLSGGTGTTTFTTPSISTTTIYYAQARNTTTGCVSATRLAVSAIINGTFNAGSIATNQTICSGSTPSTLTSTTGASGGSGTLSYEWQSSTTSSSVGFNSISSTNTSTYSPGALTQTTYFRRVATTTNADSDTSNVVTITVNPASVGGSISGGASVCTGTNSTTLTLSGYTGSIQWQKSTTSATTGFSNITDSISATLRATNLTTKTYYRAVVTSGICASANSIVDSTMVSPASVGGSVSGSATVCTGTNSTNLTLSGHTGSIVRWQSSTASDFSTGLTNIANTTTTQTASNLTATTYYRAIVKSGVCDSISSASATVTVNPASVGGSIAGSASVCTGTNSTNLTLSGHTGSIVRWQSSTASDFSTGLTNIANTTTTHTASNLTATTYYRAIIKSGVCDSISSASATVTVSPASVGGSFSGGNVSVCTGTNSTTLTLSGHTGSIQWQKSTTSATTGFTNITDSISATLRATNLTTKTYYRAVVTSGSCSAANSTTDSIMVSPTSVGGTIAGGASVCTGTNSTNLTLSGHTGSIVRWQSSTASDFSTGLTNIANTTTTQTASNLTATTYYRAIVKSGVCDSISSASATVTVNVIPSISTTTPASRCGTGTVFLGATASTGTINWYASSTGGSSLGTGTSFTTPSISSTTKYYIDATASGCTTASRDSVTATVNDIPSITATTPASRCGTGTVVLGATASTGTINWYASSTGGSSLGTGTSFTTPSISSTTKYYIDATASGCTTASRDSVTATVNNLPSTPTAGVDGSRTGPGSVNISASVSGGETIDWYAASTGGSVLSGGTGTTTFTTPSISTTTIYYAQARNTTTGCVSATRLAVSAIINGTFNAGSIATNQTICSGSTPSTLTSTTGASGGSGTLSYEWQSSTTSSSVGFNSISSTNTSTYSPGALTQTTYFRRVATTTNADSDTSNVVTITVNPASVGGSISGGATVCTGTNSTNLTLSGHTGSIVRWQSSTASDFSTGLTNIVNTTTTQTASNLTATTYYRAIVKSGVCDSISSASATVSVSPASVGGSISGGATVCSGTNSTNLTLSGHTGSIVRWQSSTASDFSSGLTNIENTTIGYTATNVTATTYYRAIIKSGVCDSASSASATISVNPISVGGTFTGGNVSVCTGTNSTTLTLSGHTGTIQWQSSTTSATSGFTNITDSISATLRANNLTTKTYYRAVVTSGVCSPVNSSVDSIMVNPASVGGSISGSATVCSGTNSTNLTLSGHTGSIVRWQSSTASDFSSGLTNIVNTTTTHTATNVTATTYYRAIIKSGVCDSASSASATISVNPVSVGGTFTGGNVSVCTGTNSTTLTLSGHTGTIQWQSSTTSATSGFTNITDSISATLRANNLTTKTYYRAVVTSGVCSPVNSSVDSIMVNPASVGGSISGSTTVCSGTNSSNLILSGYTGSIVRWQSSTVSNFSSNVTNIENTTIGYTATNVTATTYYRAIIKSGVCDSASSASATISVNPVSVGGTFTGGNVSVCTGTNSTTLTLSGHTGTIQWQSSTTSATSGFTNITDSISATLRANNLTTKTYYRAVVTSGVCSPVNSSVDSIMVNPASVGGSISGSTTVCSGTNSTNLTLSGHTGSIVRWQSSTASDFSSGLTNIANTTTTNTATNVTATTYYRAIIKSGVCDSASSASATISVNPVSVGGTFTGGNVSVCTGTNSSTLTLGGHTGTIQWQSSITSATSGFTNITDSVSASLRANNLTTKTYYRAVVTSGVCSPVNSSVDSIMVNPASVGGSISGSTTVCSGTNSSNLILSGYTGSIVRWQSSTASDFSSGLTNIVNTTTTHTASNVTATTYYRAIIKSGVCDSASSASATISVNPISVGGTFTGGNVSVCTGTNSTTLTLSGHTGTIQWQSSITSATSGFTNITDSISATLRANNLTTKTYYRAVVTSGVCSPVNSSVDSIMVNPASVGGSISGSTTVCSGTNSSNLILSGYTGSIVRWQSSTVSNFSSNVTNIENTTIGYTATNVTATTYYRAIIKSGVCDSASSASATISVNPVSVGGTFTGGNVSVCTGTNSTTLTLSGHTGTIQWQSSTTSATSGFTNITDSVSASLRANNLTTKTYYRAVVTSGVCSPVNSSVDSIMISPVSVGGSISGGATVCSGTNSTNLTLSGHTGSIVRWQSSTVSNFSSNVTNIANTTTTQTASNLTATTYYRAIIKSGVCDSASSASATISVNPVSVGGTFTGGNVSVCTGTNSTTLTLSGHTGTIQWQSSTTSATSGFTNITDSISATLRANNLTAKTYYRAVVTSGVCSPVNSSVDSIMVNPASVGGSISGSTTVCSGTNSSNLILSGYTGSIVRWQSSTVSNFSSNVTNIENTTIGYTATNVTATTYYRAIIKSGVCDSASSASATISVNPVSVGGTFTGGNVSVCTGTNSTTLTLSGHTGTIQWQSSTTSATSGFTNITDSVSATLRANNLTTKTYYRAVVTSGVCSPVNSSVDSIMVNPASVGGSISGGATVCSGTNSTNLTLSGHTGSIVRWQSSTVSNFSSNVTNIENTTTTQTASNLTATTYYRAIIKSGVCDSASSASASVSVNPVSVGGTFTGGNVSVCTGTNSTTLTLSGHTGTIQWQSSTTSATSGFTNITDSISATLRANNLTTKTYYRAVVTSGVCSPVNSSVDSIMVNPASVGGSISGSTTVCSGTNSSNLILSGHTGSIVRWQSSTVSNFSSNVTNIDNTTTTQTATNVTATTYYRAIIKSGVCDSASSASATISVNPVSVGGTFTGGNVSVCTGTNSTTLTLSGHTGTLQWQSSTTSATSGFTNITDSISATLRANNLTTKTYYRAVVTSGVCSPVNSSVDSIMVNPASVGGSISGSTTVCSGTNSSNLILSGYTGSIVRWQSSTVSNFSSNVTNIENTTIGYTATNVTATTYYRAIIKSGVCDSASSASATISVNPVSVGGTFTGGNVSVCTGTNSTTLTLSGHTGTIQWQSSTTSATSGFTNITDSVSASLRANNLTTKTYYRAVVTSGVCSPVTVAWIVSW